MQMEQEQPIRILRIVSRMNLGGVAVLVDELMKQLPGDRFDQLLLYGSTQGHESPYGPISEASYRAICLDHLTREISFPGDIIAVHEVRKFIRDFSPHVVHTHASKAGAIGRLAAYPMRIRPKLVHSYHGTVFEGSFSRGPAFAAVLAERTFSRLTDCLIVEGARGATALDRAGVGTSRSVRVMHSGVRPSRSLNSAEARLALGIPEESFVILYAARLVQVKRPDRMMRVIDTISNAISNLHVLIAGEGTFSSNVKSWAHASPANISYLGWRDNLDDLFAAADCILATSDSEGIPLTLLAAAERGLPIVSTGVGAVPEIIRPNIDGWIVETRESSLVDAVMEVYRNPSEARRRASRARDHVAQTASLENYIKAHADLYEELLSS